MATELVDIKNYVKKKKKKETKSKLWLLKLCNGTWPLESVIHEVDHLKSDNDIDTANDGRLLVKEMANVVTWLILIQALTVEKDFPQDRET